MSDIVERLKETADGMDVPPEVTEEIEEGMAEITKLRDALRPFAEIASMPSFIELFEGTNAPVYVFAEHLTAARTALGEE